MANSEQILRKLINEIATEQGLPKCDVSVKPISSGGANYTTQLYLVTVRGDKELRLFAKVAILSEKIRETLNTVFESERYFYTNIADIYRGMEDKFNVLQEDRLSLPKFYGCNPNYLEETIVLEDLVHQGFGDYNRLVSIDWPYAASAVEQLAKFHALSHAYRSRHPEEFEKDFQILKFDWGMNDVQHQTVWHRTARLAINATKEEHKERVEQHLKHLDAFPYKEFVATIHTPVMIHGDYRVSNLLHKYNDNGTVTIKIVDFQTLQRGCPVSDLLYLTLTGTDEEFRRQHFQRLMDHYYEQLCAALKRLGINPDDVYPRKIYDEEVKEKLRFALLFAVAALPLVTVEHEDAPVVRPDSDFTTFAVTKTSSVFPERLNGVINDCIRWGIL